MAPVKRLVFVAASVAALLTAGCDLFRMKWTSDVTFNTDRTRIAVGEEVEVRFQVLNDPDGRHYWVALQPTASAPDHRLGIAVAAGTKSVRLSATESGPHEVRVYCDYRGNPEMVIARRPVEVTAAR